MNIIGYTINYLENMVLYLKYCDILQWRDEEVSD